MVSTPMSALATRTHSASSNNLFRPQSTVNGIQRPPSTRPLTAASMRDENEGNYVVAVIEGRGVGREVGIAALDRGTGQAILIQLADCQTYVKTIVHIRLHSPSLIFVPDTFMSSDPMTARRPSPLLECLREEFEDVPFEQVPRKCWNDTAGLDFVTQLILDDEERPGTLLTLANKYYALSAASALFNYADTKLNCIFAPQSLRIRYRGVEGTMMIDTDTAANLELLSNRMNPKSRHSLFGLLNHSFTPMAARLLRVNILAPITVQSSIDARLDSVEELINTEEKYNSIKDALRTLKKIDIDKLISSLITSESRPTRTTQVASARVSQMLNLRSVIRSLPTLMIALQGCRSRLLCLIAEMISDERISKIDTLISNALNEEAIFAKGSKGLGTVNAKVYAVRANYDRLLDVARETYKENVDDIMDLEHSLTAEHGVTFTSVYQESGGFWFTIRKDELQGELPRGCVNVTSKGTKWKFTTMELKKKRNSRMKDSLDETLIMSDRIIQDLVANIVEEIGVLYKASEAIALVDMLWSFAHTSILHTYVRPEFTGTLAIKGGRHAVVENVLNAGGFVQNDAYVCADSTFQMVHGPNYDLASMSGKSTYLRQIGVMTVMAMCGCFVPAEYASFRIHDALLSRLSNDDDFEKSLSTFSNEMASAAMILSLATDRSLILIDELGRGTSPQEGLGISHAIAEELVHRKKNAGASGFKLNFQYRLLDGFAQPVPHYGLEMGRLADLPSDMLIEARRVAESLAAMEEEGRQASKSTRIQVRRKAMLQLKTELTQALEHSALPPDALAAYLLSLQKRIVTLVVETAET
ncbi:MutS protein msh4 [Tulasnella sp. 331]|nr:MutS protein msh4 [Tulasnella sp. 331]